MPPSKDHARPHLMCGPLFPCLERRWEGVLISCLTPVLTVRVCILAILSPLEWKSVTWMPLPGHNTRESEEVCITIP